MRQNLLGVTAVLALLVSVTGCESTDPYKDDACTSGNTFGDWPSPSANAEGPVPGSREDFMKSVKDRVHFATNKSNIDQAGVATLASQSEWLKKYPSVDVIVEGHTDERRSAEYNMALGQKRAAHAKKVLVKHGIDSKRVEIISYGKERPENQGHGEAAWAENRRAVTVIR